MEVLFVISGPIGVGKSQFAQALENLAQFERVSTRHWIREATGCENERRALQDAGAYLDEKTGGTWIADALEAKTRQDTCGHRLVLDSARIEKQVEALRDRFGRNVYHVHLTAGRETLEDRYLARPSELREFATYHEASSHGTEAQVGTLAGLADLVLDTDHSDPDTLALTAVKASRLTANLDGTTRRLVDVIVGGQYGSEGKGNICAHIARRYGALMRIGGPNAGHRVFSPPYKYTQLPSGTGSNQHAVIILGAGTTFWLPQLLAEIRDHELTPDRLVIDPLAMKIECWDRSEERRGLTAISTTGQGVGAASARKILNRGTPPSHGPSVVLARDVPDLSPFVRSAYAALNKLYRSSSPILLEGTQGTALSIHHGLYPHVTSRETSVSGCLSDAGISHARVRNVIMVVRTYPIRVANPTDGTSGWMGRELSFDDIARRSNIPLSDILNGEKGTVSGRLRRIAEFDWGQLRRATELNGATEIALTFVDYLGVGNRSAGSFAELNERAQTFIRQVDSVSGVPVSLVSKAFAIDGVIERGDWQ